MEALTRFLMPASRRALFGTTNGFTLHQNRHTGRGLIHDAERTVRTGRNSRVPAHGMAFGAGDRDFKTLVVFATIIVDRNGSLASSVVSCARPLTPFLRSHTNTKARILA